MIVAKAPARISFGGGGTDLPVYFGAFGGQVVSMAIDRYCYVTVRDPGDGMVHLHARDFDRAATCSPDELPLDDDLLRYPAAVVAAFLSPELRRRGIEITIDSEIPISAGLASSSALIVALVRAVAEYAGYRLATDELAEQACEIEIEHLERGIGKQDQYASAFGGLNAISFDAAGVDVRPLERSWESLQQLLDRLLLFNTGHTRDAAEVLTRQCRATMAQEPAVVGNLHRLKTIAAEMERALETECLDRLGMLLDDAWSVKRELSSSVSSPEIDSYYQAARRAGALGGKLCGAGGGGHLLFLSREGRQDDVRQALSAGLGLKELRFDIDLNGARLVGDTRGLYGTPRLAAVSD